MDIPKNIDDKFFAKQETPKAEARLAAQKAVDSKLAAVIKSQGAIMKAYLGSRFALSKGQAPHALRF